VTAIHWTKTYRPQIRKLEYLQVLNCLPSHKRISVTSTKSKPNKIMFPYTRRRGDIRWINQKCNSKKIKISCVNYTMCMGRINCLLTQMLRTSYINSHFRILSQKAPTYHLIVQHITPHRMALFLSHLDSSQQNVLT